MSLPDDSFTHKVLDFLEHLWPYISGMVVVFIGSIRLWWTDRKNTRKRIQTLEVLAENMVTTDDLHVCRDEVREQDEKNLDMVFKELKGLRGEIKEESRINAQQHQDLMKQIIRLHGG